MIRQKGFLDVFETGNDIAGKGILVRHLILPEHVENSTNALTSLFVEFGKYLPLSLMSQYSPVRLHNNNKALNRTLSKDEFYEVYAHALGLGFEHLFVQFPEKNSDNQPEASPLLPDFRKAEPFM
jgi:putative pyruvate formate lyase activating enzyme